jgi:hypothetical protein
MIPDLPVLKNGFGRDRSHYVLVISAGNAVRLVWFGPIYVCCEEARAAAAAVKADPAKMGGEGRDIYVCKVAFEVNRWRGRSRVFSEASHLCPFTTTTEVHHHITPFDPLAFFFLCFLAVDKLGMTTGTKL